MIRGGHGNGITTTSYCAILCWSICSNTTTCSIWVRERDGYFPYPLPRQHDRGLGKTAANAGLRVERIKLIEGRPEYLRLSAPTYAVGLAYERIVNATPRLERFRIVLMAVLQKPGKRDAN